MALTITLDFEEGCTILSYDGANAFSSIYRHRFLPALAEIFLSVVPYASNLYAQEPPKLLFALDGGGLEMMESARGVQQGCNLPPELSLEMEAIGKVTEWLQERLGVKGISLNRMKLQSLLADGVGPERLTEGQRTTMDDTGSRWSDTG